MNHILGTGEPLRSREHRSGPRHAAPTAQADRRLVGAILALALAAVVLTVLLWPVDRGSRSAGPASGTTSPEADWAQRLEELYAVRAQAFRTGQSSLLRQVYTLDSHQLRADLETIESLAGQQRTVVGFAVTLIEVVEVSLTDGSAVAVVRDEIKPFTILDASGTGMPVAGRSPARTTLTLQQVDGAWLIAVAERTVG